MDKFPATLVIDLDRIKKNYHIFCDLAGDSCAVSGVVKADGYGLGAAPVAAVLNEEGCRDYFVATPEEGAEIREIVAADSRIYVLNGYYRGFEAEYAHYNLIPVLNSLEEIGRYKNGPCVLHFNTGMNRLGIGAAETKKILDDKSVLKGKEVHCVMSHFACADEKDHPMNRTQFEKFSQIAKHFPGAKKSMANSAGAFLSSDYHFDMIRPGAGIYGLNPQNDKENPVQGVVELRAQILQTVPVAKGETVGYGASYKFEKDTVLATVSLGYADGILRSSSDKGHLFWNGVALPVRGRVSMDLLTVDLGGLPEQGRPRAGDELEVIGPHQSADKLAAAAGTIGYEILTSLGLRYERVYRYEAAVNMVASAGSISA